MSPEAQRIAIAEACPGLTFGITVGAEIWRWPSGAVTSDPLTDLNAMHEAEKVLTDRQKDIFCLRLKDSLTQRQWQMEWSLAHATAAQRAEAFLRALNRWEDKP